MSGFDLPADLPKDLLACAGRLFIGGGWAEPHGTGRIEVIDPATEQVIAVIADADGVDVDRAVDAGRAAMADPGWRDLLPAERRALLTRLADLVEGDADTLAQIETADNGMPLATARRLVAFSVETLRYCAGWVGKIGGETVATGTADQFAYTLRQPVGVIAAIVPWNAPLMMAVAKLAPALAAGCAIVLKPAELTSLSALRLAQLVARAGFPAGVVNVVTGTGAGAGAMLASHTCIRKVTFTGSPETGRSIVRAAAVNFKRVTLELGGKSPVIVLADADLDKAVPVIAAGIFGNAGQVCAAGSRIYGHRRVFDELVDRLAAHADTLRIGAGRDPSTQMGPLVSAAQRARVEGYVALGREEGARVVTGGMRPEGRGYFIRPTVLAGSRDDARVVREEIFGPVLCAVPADDDDLDALVERANASAYGLSAYVWTRDLSAAHRLAARIEAGTVRVNSGTGQDVALPFGGVKQSGWGRENGRAGIEAFLETKAVTVAL